MRDRLTALEGALWRWMSAVQKRPRAAVAAMTALAALGVTLAAAFLGVNADTSRLISAKLPFRAAQLDFRDQFPSLEGQVVLIARARTPDGADAYAAALVERLEARPDVAESVFAPAVDPFFLKNGLLYLDLDELDTLLPRLSQAAGLVRALGRDPTLERLYNMLAEAEEARATGLPLPSGVDDAYDALARAIDARLAGDPEPLSWQTVFDADEAAGLNQRIVAVTPVTPDSGLGRARRAVEAIRKIAEATAVDDPRLDAQVFVTGDVALRAEELRSVSDGLIASLVASFFAVGLLLWLAMRSAALVAASLFTLAVSICITTGFAALAFDALNLISAAFAVLMIGLGVDYAIHFVLHVQEERGEGLAPRPAMYRTTRKIGAALALCAPTSMLAFFAFAPTDFVGMRQLGVISGVGVLIAFITAMTLLPAAFALFPGARARPKADAARQPLAASDGGALRRGAAIAFLAIGLGCVALLPQVRFDADPMSLRDPKAPAVQAFQLLFDDQDTQPYSLSVLEDDAEAARATAERLEALPEVRRVVTLERFEPEDQIEKLTAIEFGTLGLADAFGRDPPAPDPEAPPARERLLDALDASQSQSAARLAAALEALAAASEAERAAVERDVFAFWPDLYERLRLQIQASEVTLDDLPAALVSRFRAMDGRYRVQIEPAEDVADPAALARFVEAVGAAEPRAAGSARSVVETGGVISRSMLQAGLLALVTVSLLLWLIVRDAILVSTLLFCLALAGVMTAAAGVLFGVPFNYANVIVVPLLVGVGADSGIHLGLQARRSGRAEAVYGTSTPKAVLFSALTTIASFGTLMLSAHRGVASMGALLTISLACTFICAALIQPWLMERFEKKESADS